MSYFHFILNLQITEKKEDRDKFSPYLDLPSTREIFNEQNIQPTGKVTLFSGPFTLSAKDSFVISSFVCSTKLTHNGNCAHLVYKKWPENDDFLNDFFFSHFFLVVLSLMLMVVYFRVVLVLQLFCWAFFSGKTSWQTPPNSEIIWRNSWK